MAEFASLYAYSDFSAAAKAMTTRVGDRPWLEYGQLGKDAEEFVSAVSETSASRTTTLDKGKEFFRAQVGFDLRDERLSIGFHMEGDAIVLDDEPSVVHEVQTACSAQRMLPDPAKVGDGRANRKGTAHLYLASNPQTAMAEVRPWVGSRITLAKFILTRKCRVVDCSFKTAGSWTYQHADSEWTPDGPTKENGVWDDIGYAFSKPVRAEDIVEYAPTQLLAEQLRNRGYDGIAYKSLLVEGGTNIVLFNVDTASQSPGRCLYRARCLSYQFQRIDGDMAACTPSVISRYCHDPSD